MRVVQGRHRTSLILSGCPKLNLAVVLALALTLVLSLALALALTLTLILALALALTLALAMNKRNFRHLLMNYGHPAVFLDYYVPDLQICSLFNLIAPLHPYTWCTMENFLSWFTCI